MKNIKSFVLAVALSVLANFASAQTMSDIMQSYLGGVVVADSQTAVDTQVMFLIKYVGSQNSATFEVAANGDITLKHGVAASEVVDNTVECDASIAASGSRNGIIDVSDPACDTLGEVMNVLNGQTNNWILVPVTGLLSDDMNAGGSGALAAQAATQAKLTNGFGARLATADAKNSTLCVCKPEMLTDINQYLTSQRSGAGATYIKENAFVGRTWIAGNRGTYTFTGASAWSVLLVRTKYSKTSSTEVVTTLLSGTPTGATTVNATFVGLNDTNRIVSGESIKVLIRVTAVTTLTAVNGTAFGYVFTGQ